MSCFFYRFECWKRPVSIFLLEYAVNCLSLILMLTLYLQLCKALADFFSLRKPSFLEGGEFNYWVVDNLI